MIELKFTNGFESEPEILFVHKNQRGVTQAKLNLWIGNFDEIISKVKPNKQGLWEGVTLHYHMHTGWYDDPWECDNIKNLLYQLESIDTSKLDRTVKQILVYIKMFIIDCIDSNGLLFIEYI